MGGMESCLSASAQKEKLFPHFLCAPPSALQEKVLVTLLHFRFDGRSSVSVRS